MHDGRCERACWLPLLPAHAISQAAAAVAQAAFDCATPLLPQTVPSHSPHPTLQVAAAVARAAFDCGVSELVNAPEDWEE